MVRQILKLPELTKLLLSQIPADFADWLDFVAIGALLAFVWEAPNLAYALLAVGMGAPYLIVGPLAGVLADRWPLRKVLVLSNLGRALVTASLFLAPDWPSLILLVALRSAVDSFFTPARQAALQALTDDSTRTAANGLSHAINQAAKIVAPGAGGAALVWLAPQMIFFANAGVSLLAALLAWRLAPIARPGTNDATTGDGLWTNLRSGLRLVATHATLRRVLIIMAASYFAMFAYDTFIAPLIGTLGFDQQHLGYTLAAVGVGGVAGASLFALLPRLSHPLRWVAGGTGISGLMALGLGLAAMVGSALPLAALLVVFLVLGFTTAMAVVPVRVVLQDTVPPHQMGAVTALSEAANTTALLSAPFLGALLAETFSIGAPFLAGAALMFAVAALAARGPSGGPNENGGPKAPIS